MAFKIFLEDISPFSGMHLITLYLEVNFLTAILLLSPCCTNNLSCMNDADNVINEGKKTKNGCSNPYHTATSAEMKAFFSSCK